MTRLDALKALLEMPAKDDGRRTSRVIEGCEKADRSKLHIEAVRIAVKPKRPKKVKSSRLSWVRGVIEQKGA
jgi:hypothetical protein